MSNFIPKIYNCEAHVVCKNVTIQHGRVDTKQEKRNMYTTYNFQFKKNLSYNKIIIYFNVHKTLPCPTIKASKRMVGFKGINSHCC